MNNFKNIIMVYHIPIDGLSRQSTVEQLYEYYKILQDDKYQDVFVFPYTDGTPKKIIIETIDLNNTINNKTVESSLEDIKMKFMKLYEPERWLRIKKLERLLK